MDAEDITCTGRNILAGQRANSLWKDYGNCSSRVSRALVGGKPVDNECFGMHTKVQKSCAVPILLTLSGYSGISGAALARYRAMMSYSFTRIQNSANGVRPNSFPGMPTTTAVEPRHMTLDFLVISLAHGASDAGCCSRFTKMFTSRSCVASRP